MQRYTQFFEGTDSTLGPPLLAERQLLALLRAAPVRLPLPRPVLPEPQLGVRGVVEINLGDLCLDEGPDSPVEARQPAVQVYLVAQPLRLLLEVRTGVARGQQGEVRLDVLGNEAAALGARGEAGVVALKAGPLGEVVGEVEGGGGGGGVFVVDEADVEVL